MYVQKLGRRLEMNRMVRGEAWVVFTRDPKAASSCLAQSEETNDDSRNLQAASPLSSELPT